MSNDKVAATFHPTTGDPDGVYPSTSVRTAEEAAARLHDKTTQDTDGGPTLTHLEESHDHHD